MSADRGTPLNQVVVTGELNRRRWRLPDYESENRVLVELIDVMAHQFDGDSVLQRLVEIALQVCRADSAGVSILERDDKAQEVFRWRAAVGQWFVHRGDVIPREGLSGTVLDRNEAMLMAYPERHYSYARNIGLPMAEVLLVPIRFQGQPVGTLWIVSHEKTPQFDDEDCRILTSFGRFAGNAYHLLKQERLVMDLEATDRLHEISTQLLRETTLEGLYQNIVDAAGTIMRSDFASMQEYYPERGLGGELRLLAHRGFTQEAARAWKWIRATSTTSCGLSLRNGVRVIIEDIETTDFLAGTADLKTFRQTGIRAMQTTPLTSRGGQILGMISTHWNRPHAPAERELHLLDILARQAADLIERSLAEAQEPNV